MHPSLKHFIGTISFKHSTWFVVYATVTLGYRFLVVLPIFTIILYMLPFQRNLLQFLAVDKPFHTYLLKPLRITLVFVLVGS